MAVATDQQITVAVIVGSIRQNRFAGEPAEWVGNLLRQREGVTVRVLDLRDYDLPLFDEPMSPKFLGEGSYEHPEVVRWTRDVEAADAFIIVSPEYNHGYSAVLKNAMDYVYGGWNRKPVTFIGYGQVGGARAIEQLRQVAVEVEMAPIQRAVHLSMETLMAHFTGGDVPAALAAEDEKAEGMLDELLWWGRALKVAREATVPALV